MSDEAHFHDFLFSSQSLFQLLCRGMSKQHAELFKHALLNAYREGLKVARSRVITGDKNSAVNTEPIK